MQILGVWIFDSFNKAQKIFPKKQKKSDSEESLFFHIQNQMSWMLRSPPAATES